MTWQQQDYVEHLWKIGPVLDQKENGPCTAYTWISLWLSEPNYLDPFPTEEEADQMASQLFAKVRSSQVCQGNDEAGSSLGTMAKAAKDSGYIKDFYQLRNLDELDIVLLNRSPVVVAVPLYENMYYAPDGIVDIGGKYTKSLHSFLITGYRHDPNLGTMYRWLNSWGTRYGDGGSAWITASDLSVLYNHRMLMYFPLGYGDPRTSQES